MNQQNLNSFLKLGYFLDYQNKHINFDLHHIESEKYKERSDLELIQMGSNIWRDAISHNFKTNTKHLVPLSGGMDSRAIIAGLLEHTEAKNIYTYTFGSANTLDYDIGNEMAKIFGTNHTSFDLTQHIYRQEELEDISRRVERQTMLFHHQPVWEVDKRFKGLQYWSGYLGGFTLQRKFDKKPVMDLSEAKKEFVQMETFVRSIDLSNGMNFDNLVECNCIDPQKLTLKRQIYFYNKQPKSTAPHVLMQGYNYKLPFLYQPWFNFMLSTMDRGLYKKILWNSFPEAFSYRTKTHFGLPLNASRSRVCFKRIKDKLLRVTGHSHDADVNYLNFNEKIRSKSDLRELISSNVMDLQARGILDWIDIEKILHAHLSQKKNHADALIVLASLEIHIKSGLKI